MTTTALAPMLTTTTPDPTKHVDYTLGMVLGVDDFTQEFAYLSGRDQWLARDLLGYGTVRGLRVHVEPDPTAGTNGPEVIVDPGIALTPDGSVARVKVAQCAYLNAWLSANPVTVTPPSGGTGAFVTLYLVISYQATATDMVPIPGEPCRSEDDASAPSRLADDFLIELVTTPPAQVEEDAMQDLFAWLGAVQIVATGGLLLPDFLTAMRASVAPTAASAALVPYLQVPSTPIQISVGNVSSFWSAALRVYVTELRANDLARTTTPAAASWIDPGQAAQAASGDLPVSTKLLLARLTVPVPASGPLSVVGTAASVLVDESRRPYLVSGELLKTAWLSTAARAEASASAATAAAAAATASTALSTANTASGTASTALSTANTASGTAAGAVTTATAASKAAADATTAVNAYSVLAAGTVVIAPIPPATPTVAAGTYKAIVAQATAAGEVTVTFSGVATPDPLKLQYIAKVIAFPSATSTILDPVVSLKTFPPKVATVAVAGVTNPRSFTLHVRNAGGDVATGNLTSLSLVIEISTYLAP